MRPPSRHSNTSRLTRLPPMECVELGHHVAKSAVNLRNASA